MMTAFDTDVLTEILAGNPVYAGRARLIDPAERAVPVVAAAEVLRGWLNAVRQAEAGKGRRGLDDAYRMFRWHLLELATYAILPYTAAADALYRQWRAAKVRIGTQDLRIAAICADQGVKLATRNARDFSQVPGLNLDIWT
jgi:tRNA(fMet)-specific endonuclease VapC